jgi:hypothetical protein
VNRYHVPLSPLKNRVSSLQIGCPVPLIVLGTVESGESAIADENSLHRQFDHLHYQGEWFRAEPELLQYIKENARDVHPFVAEEVDRLVQAPAQVAT